MRGFDWCTGVLRGDIFVVISIGDVSDLLGWVSE